MLLLLLLALLLPLVFLAGEKGQTVLMMLGLNKGPQPMYTTSVPEFVSGRGTQSEPFVLQPITGVKMGDSVESKETITITKLELGTEISITDLDSDENENRFNMDFIEVQEDEEEDEGFGSVVFRLQFNDNKAGMRAQKPDGEFIGRIRIGRASVYVLWSVTVDGDSSKRKPAEVRQESGRRLTFEGQVGELETPTERPQRTKRPYNGHL